MIIRDVKRSDIKTICEIYAHYVLNTTISFEYTPPTEEMFLKRIIEFNQKYPFLVYEIDNKVVGYVYISKHAERAAYDYNATISIYLDCDYTKTGIGKLLYDKAIELAKAMGIYNLYAVVSSPNEPSEKFHTKYGFHKICYYDKTGYKFGTWIGLTWYQLILKDHSITPTDIIPYIRKIPFD